jgi:Beta-xylosidase
VSVFSLTANAQKFTSDNVDGTFTNPVIFADVPDLDVIRVDDAYYMVSTTMHLSPGVPIMKSYDLVNCKIVNYVYDQLETTDGYALKNGQSDYSNGSWASSLKYDKYEGRFYATFSCNTSDKSYVYSTTDIENGPWHKNTLVKCYDAGLLFEDTGTECKKYIINANNSLDLHDVSIRSITVDTNNDVTFGTPTVIIPYGNIENPAQGLRAEGVHAYKIGDYYYIFMIQGSGAQRQEICWRSKSLTPGTFEVKLMFGGNIVDATTGKDYMPFTGVAQGGIVQAADGKWYSPLFEDYGAVGRIPVLIPMQWVDGWPVMGNNGKSVNKINAKPVLGYDKLDLILPDEFNNGTTRKIYSDKDVNTGITAGITAQELQTLSSTALATKVAANEYGYNGSNLNVIWQWNHNPNNNLWSLVDRPGYFRLKSGIIASNIRTVRNTLTQRTYGPVCSGNVALEVGHMKDGDVAGLAAFQNRYGFVGVKMANGVKKIVMHKALAAGDAAGAVIDSVPLNQERVYLRVDFDFRDTPLRSHTDKAYFYYSLDSINWTSIGEKLQMFYDWPDFVGYRFGLFYYSTKNTGGYVDYDYFHTDSTLLPVVPKYNAFSKNEAEDITTYTGVSTEGASDGSQNVCDIQGNDWVCYKNVNFGDNGAVCLSAQVASATSGGVMEVRLGSTTGILIGTVNVENTGGWQSWVTKNIEVTKTTGVQDVYFVFKGTGTLFNLNWWKFRDKVYSTELVLKHAYTFEDGTANDKIGNANGTVYGGCIANGAYTTSVNGQYIKLPASTIALNRYSTITTETYVKAGVNPAWTMLEYFGGLNGANAFWLSIARMDNVSRVAFNPTTSGEVGVNGTEPAAGETHHYVTVLTEDALTLYIDGNLVSTSAVPVTLKISGISTDNAWLCKGGYPDPTYLGTMYEYNIYSGVMTPEQVTARYNYFKTATGLKTVVADHSVHVFPTITEGDFSIYSNEDSHLSVYNMSGQLVLEKALKAPVDNISLSAPGMYIFKTISKNNTYECKVIKSNK